MNYSRLGIWKHGQRTPHATLKSTLFIKLLLWETTSYGGGQGDAQRTHGWQRWWILPWGTFHDKTCLKEPPQSGQGTTPQYHITLLMNCAMNTTAALKVWVMCWLLRLRYQKSQQLTHEVSKEQEVKIAVSKYQRLDLHHWTWYSNAETAAKKTDHIFISIHWRIIKNWSIFRSSFHGAAIYRTLPC